MNAAANPDERAETRPEKAWAAGSGWPTAPGDGEECEDGIDGAGDIGDIGDIGEIGEIGDDGVDGDRGARTDDPAVAAGAALAGVRAAGGGAASPAASDEQLASWVGALVDQDERALVALYDATFTRVFGLVQRIVRDAALAEEVVGEAYYQAWRQAARFDPARGRASTWLLAMARSRALDALRREARNRHEALDAHGPAEAAHAASAEPPPDELLELARHRADLHQALLKLGAQPRQLVSMSFFRGLSHEEIAVQTQLPLGTVKSQIRRALLALREMLGERGARALAS